MVRRPIILGLGSLLCGCAASLMFHVQAEGLGPRLQVFKNGGGNSTVLVHGPGDALLVDTKYRMFSRNLRRSVEDDLAARVRRIVLTHAHDDHAGGVALYPGAGAVLVHPNARKRLEAEGVRAAFVEVANEVQITLDGEPVRVVNVGSGHTDGDLVALFPNRKLLVAGDLVNDALEPYCDEAFGGSILALSHTLPALMKLDFERLVPGHGEVMPRAKVQKLADYVVALEAGVKAAKANGLSEEQAVAQLSFSEFPLDDVIFVTSRKGNIRAMYRLLP